MTPTPANGSGRELVVEADGGSRGNPGVAGYGALVRDAATGRVLVELAEPLGLASNNVAEYSGLVAGLRAAAEIDPGARVHVRMDSKLVVEQMSGRWKIKHPDMQELALEARTVCTALRAAGGSVDFEWIPRERNKDADALSNEAMDGHSVRRVLDASSGLGQATDAASEGSPEPQDLRLLLVQAPETAAAVDRIAAAAHRLLGGPARIQSSPDSLAAQVGAALAAATGGAAEVVDDWSAAPAAKRGRAGTAGADEASGAAYRRLREVGGTWVVVTSRRGVLTVLTEVLGLRPERFWAPATAPGSLTGVEVWADGTASVAFTNRTDHLA